MSGTIRTGYLANRIIGQNYVLKSVEANTSNYDINKTVFALIYLRDGLFALPDPLPELGVVSLNPLPLLLRISNLSLSLESE